LLELLDHRPTLFGEDHARLFEFVPLDVVDPRGSTRTGDFDGADGPTDVQVLREELLPDDALPPCETVRLDDEGLGLEGRTTRGDRMLNRGFALPELKDEDRDFKVPELKDEDRDFKVPELKDEDRDFEVLERTDEDRDFKPLSLEDERLDRELNEGEREPELDRLDRDEPKLDLLLPLKLRDTFELRLPDERDLRAAEPTSAWAASITTAAKAHNNRQVLILGNMIEALARRPGNGTREATRQKFQLVKYYHISTVSASKITSFSVKSLA